MKIDLQVTIEVITKSILLGLVFEGRVPGVEFVSTYLSVNVAESLVALFEAKVIYRSCD